MESKVKDGSYVNIQSFMVKDLKLSGNDLIIYALIYGFCQDGETMFQGSLSYMAEWTSSTKRGIQKTLLRLCEKQLIIKHAKTINNVIVNEYSINWNLLDVSKFTGVEQSSIGVEQSSPNNINNNIEYKENYTKESQNRNEQPSPTPTFLQNTDDSITPKVRKGTANIVSNEDIEKYFETTYSIYPRKVNKQQAKKTYEHKFRGLSIVDAKNLANRIYKALQRQIALWQAENKGNGRELEYIPHFSSWLNDNIEDSKNFKKGR